MALWKTGLPVHPHGQQQRSGLPTRYHYRHTDHLGTPALATTKEGVTSWKAVAEAFGAAGTLPESSITMDLRFPGQYFDQETGAHYNFNRDYRPIAGRYVQGDPIGLAGGENFYIYVKDNRKIYIDPLGKIRWSGAMVMVSYVQGQGAVLIYYDLEIPCKCGKSIKIKGLAIMGAIGYGVNVTGSLGPADFEDGASCPSERAANGAAFMGSFSFQIG